MHVVRIGLDLAKYVFEVHGVDSLGKFAVRKTLRRDAVARFFAICRDVWSAWKPRTERIIGQGCFLILAMRFG
jgi:transposase